MAIHSHLRSSSSLKVNDLGIGRIIEELNKADKSHTKVGFPIEGEVKSGTRKGSGRDPSEDIAEVAEVAIYNEIGAPKAKVPARPFISTSFDENLQKINDLKLRLYNQIIDGRMTTIRALGLMGEAHVNHIKRKMRDIQEPPNAPLTVIRKKGISNPLIDTAQMLNSVQHVEKINV